MKISVEEMADDDILITVHDPKGRDVRDNEGITDIGITKTLLLATKIAVVFSQLAAELHKGCCPDISAEEIYEEARPHVFHENSSFAYHTCAGGHNEFLVNVKFSPEGTEAEEELTSLTS